MNSNMNLKSLKNIYKIQKLTTVKTQTRYYCILYVSTFIWVNDATLIFVFSVLQTYKVQHGKFYVHNHTFYSVISKMSVNLSLIKIKEKNII